MSLPTIILNGFLSLCLLSGLGIKESEIRTKSAKVDSLSAVVSALSKPPKKKDSTQTFSKSEFECTKHKYKPLLVDGKQWKDYEMCQLCGRVLLPEEKNAIKLERRDKHAPTHLMKDSCCIELAKAKKELNRKPKQPKLKHDTIVRHDTITKVKVVQPLYKK